MSVLASSLAAAAPDPEVMALGQTGAATCMACHGADGKGMDVGPQKMAPSLAGSPIVLGDPEAFALSLLKGIKKEDAKYLGVMAALGATFANADGDFDAQKMAATMTFVRNSYGNEAEAVDPEAVQGYYEKYKDRLEPATRAELQELASGGEGAEEVDSEEASAE